MPAVAFHAVAKRYRLYSSPWHRLRDMLLRRSSHDERWALRDVSFAVGRGETVAIIGRNGAGKSTLLRLIASGRAPTAGHVSVDGRVGALLELGTGFQPEWSGRENVLFQLRLRGTRPTDVRARLLEIERFAGIGSYFDQPLRTYSSGMAIRVAFATAALVDCDIFIIDEALAVGDAAFVRKCYAQIERMKERGVTILFVTHRLDLVPQLCTRGIVLDDGRVAFDGSAKDAIDHYFARLFSLTGSQGPEGGEADAAGAGAEFRMGVGGARIETIRAIDVRHRQAGGTASFEVDLRFDVAVAEPIAGFSLRTAEGVLLYATNTAMLGTPLAAAAAGSRLTIRIDCPLPFPAGLLFADFAIGEASGGDLRIFDGRMSAARVEIEGGRPVWGLVDAGAVIGPV